MSISRRWQWAGIVLLGAAAGVLAVKPVVRHLVEGSSIRNGPWRTLAEAGSADANIYERAAVAAIGLYALSRQETIYYTTFNDGAGQPLDGRCDYRISGRPPAADWWSLTLYGEDNYLVANDAGIYSRHARNLEFETDGHFEVPVSAQPPSRNGLPSPSAGPFSITLRLYHPGTEVRSNPGGVELPQIVRGDCR